jgi:hypothetical protein
MMRTTKSIACAAAVLFVGHQPMHGNALRMDLSALMGYGKPKPKSANRDTEKNAIDALKKSAKAHWEQQEQLKEQKEKDERAEVDKKNN